MRLPEVVIVGGGVIGASVAYHLAAAGCPRVHVVDAGSPGQGSTGRATGGFRAQFGSEIEVRLSLLAREKLLRFREEVGRDPGFRRCGYLFLATSEPTLRVLEAATEVQRRVGHEEVRVVSAREVSALNPAVRLEGVVGGTFGPGDGFLRPLEILRGYTEAARRWGATFDYGRRCSGFRTRGGRVDAVETDSGPIRADVIVNAAGAWASAVAAMAGVDLPVRPLRRQVAITESFGGLPEDMPMTIFADDGFHLRVRDGRVLLLLPDDPGDRDPFDTTVDRAWFERVLRCARERVPCLRGASARFEDCWAGLYEMSPDSRAVLGRAPGIENLFLVNGSSGHGVMHAPALGQLLTEIILDGATRTLDVRALSPERFAEGTVHATATLL